jgi:hypothetical protein
MEVMDPLRKFESLLAAPSLHPAQGKGTAGQGAHPGQEFWEFGGPAIGP